MIKKLIARLKNDTKNLFKISQRSENTVVPDTAAADLNEKKN